MISILAIVALVFALLCVAAWYNQPERYEFIGAWLALGKAARDASVKVVEFKEAKEAIEDEVNDGQ